MPAVAKPASIDKSGAPTASPPGANESATETN
jgi:hypothetical protein